jgi:hypothetical protein
MSKLTGHHLQISQSREVLLAKALGWLTLLALVIVLALGAVDIHNHGWGPRSSPASKSSSAGAQ